MIGYGDEVHSLAPHSLARDFLAREWLGKGMVRDGFETGKRFDPFHGGASARELIVLVNTTACQTSQ